MKKSVTFVATKYRNQPVRVNFYTKSGERVSFNADKKMPVKQVVRFNGKKGKK